MVFSSSGLNAQPEILLEALASVGLVKGFPQWPVGCSDADLPDLIQQWQHDWHHAVCAMEPYATQPEWGSYWASVASAAMSALLPWWGPYPDMRLTETVVVPVLEALEQLGRWAPPRGSGWLVMGQINPTPCRLDANAQQIRRGYRLALLLQADAFICPELSLMGYPVGDVILRMPALVQHQLQRLQELVLETGETSLLVGFAEPIEGLDPTKTRAPYYNAVAVAQQGRQVGVVRKAMLPNYNEYTDSRLFRPAPMGTEADKARLWDGTLGGGRTQYGIAVCYDWWHNATSMPETTCPVSDWMHHHPQTQVLINCSASPSRAGKLATRFGLFQKLAAQYQCSLVYVNQSGGIDEHVFDGASSVVNAQGQWVARGPAFQPALWMVNPSQSLGVVAPHPEAIALETASAPSVKSPTFDPNHTHDIARAVDAVTYGIAEYFQKSGFQRAVLGLSGGLDSSITAVLAVRALGAKNVLGVFMPSGITQPQSQADMEALVSALGIPSVTLPIGQVIQPFHTHRNQAHDELAQTWGRPSSASYALDNIQATSRASVLRMLANDFGALPLATSDKSELYMGYATVNGDMSGALAPLGDVVKTKLFAMGQWLNQQSGASVIPESVLKKPPGAELALDATTGKPLNAEDALMPYLFADEVIFQLERYRRHPMALLAHSFVYEERVGSLPEAQKKAWLEKFTWRMQTAAFKWWVAPPILITDADGSLAHRDYMHPTVAQLLLP